MKKYLIICIFLLSALSSYAQFDVVNDKNWTNWISDSFNYSSLTNFRNNGLHGISKPWSAFLWGTQKGDTAYESNDSTSFQADHCHNIEIHTDTPGYLRLTIKNESSVYAGKYWDTAANSWTSRNYHYTRGVLSMPTVVGGFKYGFVEMRFRLPDWVWRYSNMGSPLTWSTNVRGLSSALWMYEEGHPIGHGTTWSEIDMMENFDGFNDQTDNVHYTDSAHNRYHCPGCDSGSWYARSNGINTPMTFSGNFHILGMNWCPDSISFYYDHHWIGNSKHYSDKLIPMGLIIDLGVNAYVWKKNGVTDTTYKMIGYTNFPYQYDIDYINVWQLGMDCANAISICKVDPATYDYKVKKSIWVTGRCSTDIVSGQNVTMRATDYVRIDKNFTIEKGATFEIIPTSCH